MIEFRFRHLLAALCVVLIWGFNYPVIKAGLREIPPIFLGFLRFTLSALPAVFFLKRPDLPWRKIIQYGLANFTLHFSFLFSGMYWGVSAGLASLVLQVHVFVTIALAAAFIGERPSLFQLAGAIVAFLGILVIALNVGGDVTPLGLACVLLGALSWGTGSVIARGFKKFDALSLVVWGSLVAAGPLLMMSLILEGPERIATSVREMSWLGVGVVVYQVYPTTLLGFAIWSWLLRLYPAASVAPLSLLVPVFGMASSALVMGEQMQEWKLLAAVLVIGGLCINLFGAGISGYLTKPRG